VETIKARLKALEDLNKPSVEVLLRKISALAMKSGSDFDKYEALPLAEELVRCASNTHHEKFTYYSVALQKIRQRLHKPTEQFKAYFLALFSDRGYGKVCSPWLRLTRAYVASFCSPRRAAFLTWPVSDAVGLATTQAAVGFRLKFGGVPHLPYRALDPSSANYPFFYVLGLFAQ